MALLDLDQQRETVDGKADSAPEEALRVEARGENLLAVSFIAMASPCVVLLPLTDAAAAAELWNLVAQEAWRVEKEIQPLPQRQHYRLDS